MLCQLSYGGMHMLLRNETILYSSRRASSNRPGEPFPGPQPTGWGSVGIGRWPPAARRESDPHEAAPLQLQVQQLAVELLVEVRLALRVEPVEVRELV